MDLKKIFNSRAFLIATWSVGGLIILLLVFKSGVAVGYKKAGFSYRWGENYHRNFAGPKGGFFEEFVSDRKNFIESHGVVGQVAKVDGATLIVKGRDNVEKIIITNDNSVINRFRETIKLSDLKADDYIVIIGSPNDAGQIEAKLIRVIPPLGSMSKFRMMLRR